MTLVKVCAFTAKNEIFPRWNSLYHNGGVIPSGNIVVNIRVTPFVGVQVENDDVVELSFRVPATVGVKLVVDCEKTVATSTRRKWRLGDHWLMLGPDFGLNVKRVNVAKGNTSIVKTAMSSIDVEFTLKEAASSIGTGSGRVYGRLLVVHTRFVSHAAAPGQVRDFEPPGVIKSCCGA